MNASFAVRATSARCLAFFLTLFIASNALAASLTVTPAMGVGGGPEATEVTVTVTGLTWPNTYQLDFAGSPATNIMLLTPNETGNLTLQLPLPSLPLGSGRMRIKAASTSPTVIASTAFTSLAPLSFSTSASNIHAGQSIPFDVSGLSTGSLTVLYEDVPAFGPVAVSNGSFNSKFLVPTDRPAQLPATAQIRVVNKVGNAIVNQKLASLSVRSKLTAPFRIGITQPPPNQPFRGQNFQVAGEISLSDNEAAPDSVSLWYFGDDGEVFPLGSARTVATGNQYQYSMFGSAPGGLSMTASANEQGDVRMVAEGATAVGMKAHVQQMPVSPSMNLLADGRWRIRVRVVKTNGQPIAGALVQFDGAPVVAHESGEELEFNSIYQYVNSDLLLTQYQQATDSRGCPLTLARKLTDANGIADFEFLDEDLTLAQAPRIIANAGGQIETAGQISSLLLAIDASAAGYGFQFTSGPLTGDFLPHIYRVNFIGTGDDETEDDYIELVDDYQDVVVFSGPRDSQYTLPLPAIQPMVGLYDKTILPWIGHSELLDATSANEGFGAERLVFGPVYSKSGINVEVIDRPGEGYPTSIAVRTDPAVSGVVTEAKLYLNADRNGSPEFIADFIRSQDTVDCSISGLNASITWRASIANLDIANQASGRINGYLYFKGSAQAGEAKEYIGINVQELDVDWLEDSRYSESEVEFSNGGQRVGVFGIEDTADAEVELDRNPGYQIGRLKNSTDNTRLVAMYRNSNGSDTNAAPLDGAHKEAGRNGSPTMVDAALDVQYGPYTTTLIDQSFPLFYYVWGVPVLAGIEVGADFSLLAEIETRSKFSLKPNKEPQFTMKTTPSLDLGLNFYLDIDVLFDLVDGGVDLDAIFALQMPITVDALHPNGSISECFTASLIFSWHFEVFCLPLDFICDAFNDIEGRKVLLSDQTGSGCASQAAMSPLLAGVPSRPSARIVPLHNAVAYSENGRGFMAFTRDNSSGGAPPVLIVRPVDGGDFGRSPDDVILSTAPGIRSVDISFYDDDHAVVVWAESDQDYPTLSRMSVVARLARQRLMYSTFNGSTWSAKAALTSASGGEGGVELASCPPRTDQCPAGGEIFAVWTRDTRGNITHHRTRVYSSRFIPPSGWTAPTAVDGSALLDSSPSAAYVDGKPVVAFVRSTNGDFGDTDARRIAYRFVSVAGSQVVVPAGLPGGVAWPSIIGQPDGKFVIAHTYASDASAFVGNTQRVALANASDCVGSTCNIVAQSLTDANGRPIYGERPTPVVDASGNVTVVMRAMGYGIGSNGSNVNPRDPIGMALHTGEVISFAVDPQQAVVTPRALSSDGAGHFAPNAAFDPSLGQVVVTSTRGLEIPFQLRQKYLASGAEPQPARAKGMLADPGLLVFSAEQGVDLAVETVTPQSTDLVAGSTIRIDTLIRNLGARFSSLQPAYQLKLSWDAPHDAGGLAAGSRFLSSLASGEARTTSLNVVVPAGFAADQAHRLYASIVRGSNPVADVDASNDSLYASFGGLPTPYQLNASSIPNTSLVQLTWATPDDPLQLIAGYRVWCHDGDGVWRHLGSSFKTGFLDLAAPSGVQRHYQVTSYSKSAVESEPSAEAVSSGVAFDRIFADSFD